MALMVSIPPEAVFSLEKTVSQGGGGASEVGPRGHVCDAGGECPARPTRASFELRVDGPCPARFDWLWIGIREPPMLSGVHRYPAMEQVMYGSPALEAVTSLADSYGAKRLLLV